MSVETLREKSRKGLWTRPGAQGSNPQAPGSYGKYVLIRSPPRPYPRTPQQSRIAEAGRQVGKDCRGKKGSDFTACRSDTLAAIFKGARPTTQERMRIALEAQTAPISPATTPVVKTEVPA